MHGHGQSATPNRRMNIGQYLWRMYEYGRKEMGNNVATTTLHSMVRASAIAYFCYEKNKRKTKFLFAYEFFVCCDVLIQCGMVRRYVWVCVCVRIGREVFLLFLLDSNFFLLPSCLFAYQQNKIREIKRVKKMNEDGVSAERGWRAFARFSSTLHFISHTSVLSAFFFLL